MENNFGFYLAIAAALSAYIVILVIAFFNARKRGEKINSVIKLLDAAGIKMRHSIKFVNKENGKISYFRLYKVYMKDNKTIYAEAYLCDSDGNIGVWADDYNVLIGVAIRSTLTDNGEWKLDPKTRKIVK